MRTSTGYLFIACRSKLLSFAFGRDTKQRSGRALEWTKQEGFWYVLDQMLLASVNQRPVNQKWGILHDWFGECICLFLVGHKLEAEGSKWNYGNWQLLIKSCLGPTATEVLVWLLSWMLQAASQSCFNIRNGHFPCVYCLSLSLSRCVGEWVCMCVYVYFVYVCLL